MSPSLFAHRSFWMPPQSSTAAEGIDWSFMFIYWLSVGFFALIVGLMALFVYKFKRKQGVEPPKSPSHNLKIEVAWTVLPLFIVFYLFYIGFEGFASNYVAPSNSYPITAHGKKWNWTFYYPNSYNDGVLHVPLDTPVEVKMTSLDVIHSLFIPAFRVKKDVIPARYTSLWFKATELGEFNLFCAEYCGQQHSDMITKVIVHPPLEAGKDVLVEKERLADSPLPEYEIPYEVWLATASDIFRNVESGKETLADVGRTLYEKRGCAQCHSIDGTEGASSGKKGPSFKGNFGETFSLSKGGDQVVVDENYLLESMKDPSMKVRNGFENIMPVISSQFREEREYHAIIEFIKSLNGVETISGQPAADSGEETSESEAASEETNNTEE
ncbi:Cytochrome c oxidase subunit 2 precursor [Polystyrenella longa]|uniref:Cytochrome c oxidase subunit 2 n=1 Tax=Polystyrenella longa TaxID=2528007 RepID=A0A518CNK2_9PLAN|nr:cytochrome c oxidase subunit II [Polystyrenella longa]QDU80799.1 Cytochrome c oxidase subunit 2 precursor [Polystyrenella longa]